MFDKFELYLIVVFGIRKLIMYYYYDSTNDFNLIDITPQIVFDDNITTI
jgi:hypothetical protein